MISRVSLVLIRRKKQTNGKSKIQMDSCASMGVWTLWDVLNEWREASRFCHFIDVMVVEFKGDSSHHQCWRVGTIQIKIGL